MDTDADPIDLEDTEFQDYDGDIWEQGRGLDFSQLVSPASLRGIAAIVVSLIVLSASSQSTRLVSILVAVVLTVWALGVIAQLRLPEHRTAIAVGQIVLLAGTAAALYALPNITARQLGVVAGMGLIVCGIGAAIQAYQAPRGFRAEGMVGASLYGSLGFAVAISPETVLDLAIISICLFWFAAGLISVTVNIRRASERNVFPSAVWTEFLLWLQKRPNTADDRRQLYEKVFFEGSDAGRRLSRFLALMLFASGISAWGIIADSTAVVIGAMLVAPLMTALMAMALAIGMGWPRRALMSFLVALAGVLVAVGLGIGVGWAYPIEISAELNSQVWSRVNPNLIDLAIAVFAGAAGAFALSRPDVSDSLPGVAVAIALVPPLSVVGLMISQEDWSNALGATLLFVTNLVAILLVGALVFVLVGVVPVVQLLRNSRWVTIGVGIVASVAIVVISVLGFSSYELENEALETSLANTTIDGWLVDTDLERVTSSVSSASVTATIQGSDSPPAIEDLAASLEAALGRAVDVEVDWVPRTFFQFDADG